MKTIEELQQEIVSDFQSMGDSFDRYAYLVELGCILPPMPAREKTDGRLVEGCQSRVWLLARCRDSLFCFDADSDTLVVKGILYLFQQLFCGQRPADVARAEVTFLKDALVMETFPSSRQKGIGYVLSALQRAAAGLAEQEPRSAQRPNIKTEKGRECLCGDMS